MSTSNFNMFSGDPKKIRRDLKLTRKALKAGRNADYRNWFRDLARAGIADLRLERTDDEKNGWQYVLRWLESGQRRLHRGMAKFDSASRRLTLVLEEFPRSIRPMALLSGIFYSHRTIEHELDLPEENSLQIAAPEQFDDLASCENRLAADSDDETGEFHSLLDGPELQDADEDTQDADSIGLAAPSKPEFLVNWSGSDKLLTIRFTPRSANGLKPRIPIVIGMEYTDENGVNYGTHFESQSPNYVQPIFGQLKLTEKGSGTWFCSIKADRPSPDKASFYPVKLKVNSCIPEDVIRLGGEDERKSLQEVNSYLASNRFKACVGTVKDSKAYFSGITDQITSKKDLLIRIFRNTEAETEDVAPFDADVIANILIELQPSLIRKAARGLEYLDAESYAEQIVADLLAKLTEKLCSDDYWQRIWSNRNVDDKGPLGGKVGVRRKIWNRLGGELTNFKRKFQLRRTCLDSDFADPKFSPIVTAAQPDETPRVVRQQDALDQFCQWDAELMEKYLNSRERLVWSRRSQSVAQIVESVKSEIPNYTANKARTDLDNATRKQRIHRTIKRLYAGQNSEAPSLSPLEYEVLIRSCLLDHKKAQILSELKLHESQWQVMKRRVDLVIETTIAAIDLYVGTELGRKSKLELSSKKGKSKSEWEGVIRLSEFELLLDWLVRPQSTASAAMITCMMNRSQASVEVDLVRLGLLMHAQLVINQNKLSKDSKKLLRLWVIQGQNLSNAVDKLQICDVGACMKEICEKWETTTSPVPSEYRILPE